jgi:hypothetical protein
MGRHLRLVYLPGRLTDARVRGMVGAGAEVFTRHCQLMLRGLNPVPAVYRGFVLHPDDGEDPYAFRIDLSEFRLSTARVVFSREPGTGTMAAHLDVMPLSVQKQPATTNPRLWLTGTLTVATTAIASAARHWPGSGRRLKAGYAGPLRLTAAFAQASGSRRGAGAVAGSVTGRIGPAQRHSDRPAGVLGPRC